MQARTLGLSAHVTAHMTHMGIGATHAHRAGHAGARGDDGCEITTCSVSASPVAHPFGSPRRAKHISVRDAEQKAADAAGSAGDAAAGAAAAVTAAAAASTNAELMEMLKAIVGSTAAMQSLFMASLANGGGGGGGGGEGRRMRTGVMTTSTTDLGAALPLHGDDNHHDDDGDDDEESLEVDTEGVPGRVYVIDDDDESLEIEEEALGDGDAAVALPALPLSAPTPAHVPVPVPAPSHPDAVTAFVPVLSIDGGLNELAEASAHKVGSSGAGNGVAPTGLRTLSVNSFGNVTGSDSSAGTRGANPGSPRSTTSPRGGGGSGRNSPSTQSRHSRSAMSASANSVGAGASSNTATHEALALVGQGFLTELRALVSAMGGGGGVRDATAVTGTGADAAAAAGTLSLEERIESAIVDGISHGVQLADAGRAKTTHASSGSGARDPSVSLAEEDGEEGSSAGAVHTAPQGRRGGLLHVRGMGLGMAAHTDGGGGGGGGARTADPSIAAAFWRPPVSESASLAGAGVGADAGMRDAPVLLRAVNPTEGSGARFTNGNDKWFEETSGGGGGGQAEQSACATAASAGRLVGYAGRSTGPPRPLMSRHLPHSATARAFHLAQRGAGYGTSNGGGGGGSSSSTAYKQQQRQQQSSTRGVQMSIAEELQGMARGLELGLSSSLIDSDGSDDDEEDSSYHAMYSGAGMGGHGGNLSGTSSAAGGGGAHRARARTGSADETDSFSTHDPGMLSDDWD